jgi:hypothetical protein
MDNQILTAVVSKTAIVPLVVPKIPTVVLVIQIIAPMEFVVTTVPTIPTVAAQMVSVNTVKAKNIIQASRDQILPAITIPVVTPVKPVAPMALKKTVTAIPFTNLVILIVGRPIKPAAL